MAFTIAIELGPETLEKLARPVVGQGGFQSLLREIQRQVTGNTLILDEALIQRMSHYVASYGQGGFQGRLDSVLGELAVLARLLEPMVA